MQKAVWIHAYKPMTLACARPFSIISERTVAIRWGPWSLEKDKYHVVFIFKSTGKIWVTTSWSSQQHTSVPETIIEINEGQKGPWEQPRIYQEKTVPDQYGYLPCWKALWVKGEQWLFLSFFPGLSFFSDACNSPHPKGMRNGGSGQAVTAPSCCSFLFALFPSPDEMLCRLHFLSGQTPAAVQGASCAPALLSGAPIPLKLLWLISSGLFLKLFPPSSLRTAVQHFGPFSNAVHRGASILTAGPSWGLWSPMEPAVCSMGQTWPCLTQGHLRLKCRYSSLIVCYSYGLTQQVAEHNAVVCSFPVFPVGWGRELRGKNCRTHGLR